MKKIKTGESRFMPNCMRWMLSGAVLCLIISARGEGGIWYVKAANYGKTGLDGLTEETAWGDLQTAHEKAAAGDPVVLRRIKLAEMTYLFSDVARDALIAKQYASEKNHPFHSYIKRKSKINAARLLKAVKLARTLGVSKVRGNCEPGNLEAIIAAWAYPLQINIAPFYEIFYPSSPRKTVKSGKKGAWKLVFEDNFNRKDLGKNWKIIHGNWKIENGALSGRGDAIYINKKFPGDQKLCFEARVAPGGTACDLDGILADKKMERYGNSGYLFAFGTYGNNFSKINREKVQILRIASPVIQAGKTHRIVCEKSGNFLRWSIDGKTVAEYRKGFQGKGEHFVHWEV